MSSHSWHVVFWTLYSPACSYTKFASLIGSAREAVIARGLDWRARFGGWSSFETGRILRFLIAVMLAERLDCVSTGAPSADLGVNFRRPIPSGFQPVK